MDGNNQLAFVGQLIKEKRDSLGWSQRDLADALTQEGYPIKPLTVGRIEAGENIPQHLTDAKFVAALTRVLQISRYDLLSAAGLIRDMRMDNRVQRMAELLSDLTPINQELVEDLIKLLLAKQVSEK